MMYLRVPQPLLSLAAVLLALLMVAGCKSESRPAAEVEVEPKTQKETGSVAETGTEEAGTDEAGTGEAVNKTNVANDDGAKTGPSQLKVVPVDDTIVKKEDKPRADATIPVGGQPIINEVGDGPPLPEAERIALGDEMMGYLEEVVVVLEANKDDCAGMATALVAWDKKNGQRVRDIKLELRKTLLTDQDMMKERFEKRLGGVMETVQASLFACKDDAEFIAAIEVIK